ncbi:MAG TPA: M4 family peptidase [Gammaproteobacteria bacterium]|nr:M4 family peptidase [Gammaproteobacteria bacterium]
MKSSNILWLALLALALPGGGSAGDSGSEPLLDSLRPLYPAPEVTAATRAATAEETSEEFRASAGEIGRILRELNARVTMAAASEGERQAVPGLEVEMGPFGTPATITVTDSSSMPESEAASTANLPNETLLRQEAAAFLAKYRTLLRLEEPERELRFTRLHRDGKGHSHLRYTQSYRGVPVWGTGLILHLDRRGRVTSMDGKYIPSPGKIPLTPQIDSARAVAAAKEALQVPAGTTPPSSATLVIHADHRNGTPVLAWKVILELSLARHMVTLVDAGSGEVMFSYNDVRHESVPGRGKDALGTPRDLTVWKEREGEYYLLDASSMGMPDDMVDPMVPPYPARGVIRILDAENRHWQEDLKPIPIGSSSAESGWLKDGVGAAYNILKAYNYYRDTHNYDSLDNNKRSIVAIVRVGKDWANAAYIPGYGEILFGDSDYFSSSLDSVGHEYTHGVTSNTSGLLPIEQSGALGESLSDIFGEAIERAVTGSNDWIVGTKLRDPDHARNMKQPDKLEWSLGRPYPTKMSEYEELPLENDGGGAHINSSIINRAFYLLAEGLDNAIGMESAARIFYRANTIYLLPGSNFADMRRAAIRAAKDLYPKESSKKEAVEDAFDAVEVFEVPPAPQPPWRKPIDAEDSVVTIIPRDGRFYLGRREKASGDTEYLTSTPVQPRRPAVSANGDIVAFISEDFDLCFVGTNGLEICLNKPGRYHSVAISPDAKAISYVRRDPSTREALPLICVEWTDSPEDNYCYLLQSAGMDGSLLNTVAYAGAMDFTADNRYIFYDALNRATLANGKLVGVWSIYALDLVSGDTVSLFPPMKDIGLASPSLSNLNPALITFEAFDAKDNLVYVGNLETGELVEIARTETKAIPAFPALNGDDTAVIYSNVETSPKGYYPSLYRQEIGKTLQPREEPSEWLSGGLAGVIYRRGELSMTPRADIKVSQEVEGKEFLADATIAFNVTVANSGPASATGLVLYGNHPWRWQPLSLPDGCEQNGAARRITCQLPELKSGQQKSLQFAYRTTTKGEFSHRVEVASRQALDPDSDNNVSYASVKVVDNDSPPRDSEGETGAPPASTRDGGGGGGGGALILLPLFLLLWLPLRHCRFQLR